MNYPWIQNYLGLEYITHGRDASGIDCWGLIKLIHRDLFNIDIPDYSDYGDSKDRDGISLGVKLAKSEGIWVPQQNPKEFDVVLFNIYGWPVHIGMCIDSDLFIHASDRDLVRIERLSSPIWVRRIEGFYRHANVPDNR